MDGLWPILPRDREDARIHHPPYGMTDARSATRALLRNAVIFWLPM